MTGYEHEAPTVLSAEQCAEIASALAVEDARKAEVMLYAAQHPHEALTADKGFTEQERRWAAEVRSLRRAADLDFDAAIRRLDAAIRSETADLLERCDVGDESAGGLLRLLGVHVLEQASAIVEQTGLPLESLDFAIVGARSRAEALTRGDQPSQTGSWLTVVEELRDLADMIGQVSVNLYNHVAWVERQDWSRPPSSGRAQLPRRQWEALEEGFDDICAETEGALESLHDRGRGILETLRPRSALTGEAAAPVTGAEAALRRECYEVIGALVHFVDDAPDNPDFCLEVGEKVSRLGGRMLASLQEPDAPIPTDDLDSMLRRIDHAVDADVGALYERKDAGDDRVLPLLRRRALHLLELGICEAGEAGVDVTSVETTVEAAFDLRDAEQ